MESVVIRSVVEELLCRNRPYFAMKADAGQRARLQRPQPFNVFCSPDGQRRQQGFGLPGAEPGVL
jgi:hypothetical protein